MAQSAGFELFFRDGELFPTGLPNEIWSLNLRTRKTRLILAVEEPGFSVGSLAVSPDRQHLAFGYVYYDPRSGVGRVRAGLRMMRSDGSAVRTLAETEEDDWEYGVPVWASDGSQLMYARQYLPDAVYPRRETIHIIDLDLGTDETVTDEGGPFDWSPTADEVAFTTTDRHAVLTLSLGTGEKRVLCQSQDLVFGRPAWHPNGRQIAVPLRDWSSALSPSAEAGLYLIDVASGNQRKLADGQVQRHSWSPDGQMLAYATFGSNWSWPWLVTVDGSLSRRLLYEHAFPGTPAWSPDGKMLLLAIEHEPGEEYWISLKTPAGQGLETLVLSETGYPFVTW
jgi:dipeptidyl aminopeptidase/acylaminoacyl peptidase